MRKKSIKSDLKKLDALSDKEIDYSDLAPLDDSFFSRATVELFHPFKIVYERSSSTPQGGTTKQYCLIPLDMGR
jgi:hypothetical protein